MVEDRLDGSFSYFEFLQHLKQQSKWKTFFFIKTQIPYLNKLIIFSLSGFVFGFFLPQNWPKIGFFLRTILSNWIKFYTPDFMNLKIQSVNVMNEYYVCFFVKEQKKEKSKKWINQLKKMELLLGYWIFIPVSHQLELIQ